MFSKYFFVNKCIILSFILIFIYTSYKKDRIYYNINVEDDIMTSVERSKNFIIRSSNGILDKKPPLKNFNNQRISSIIPLYNCENTILRAIRSIQNQNIEDIEIILVNDFSKDKTLMMINQFQKEDPRIIIINNKKRMGTLYSRSIGTLAAKGKYLFPLDNDDMFLDSDIFNYIFNEANNNNYDIVKFRGLWARSIEDFMLKRVKTKLYMNHRIGLILHQPELSYFPIRKHKDYFRDVFLWGKCIKSEIYKSAINLYGEKNYSEFIIGWEDGIINFVICQISNSFKFIGKYGVFNIISENSSYFKALNTDNNIYEIKFLQAVFNFSKDSYKGKEIIVYLVTTLLHRKLFKKTLENKALEKLFNSIFKKIMECPYISINDKNIMKNTYSSVLEKKFVK